MTIIEIQEIIMTLLTYQDSEINHLFKNRYELSYSKTFQHVRICDTKQQTISCYEEIEEASLALFHLLHKDNF
ncbi:hypothetical protein [Priestia megaterium]|uniref:hypothetical protein n=1 Tax=Priestia megaterium TaxID=1404 RepID=UPI00366F4D20